MNYIKFILIIVYFHFAICEFKLSEVCIKDNKMCSEEELDYKAIAELHNQMDDDKNGDIDITESKDFVKTSLSHSHGTERAKMFHKQDSHINKEDLWNIWKSNEVYNWTTGDLVTWITNEVELPQYSNIIQHLAINGSFMPRLTEMQFLSDIMLIANPIHRRKIMIKAVDTVLFGSNQRYQISKQAMITTGVIFFTIIIYLIVQNHYSKRYVRTMQSRLDNLSEAADNVANLREKLQEVEEMKIKKDFEIRELTQKHKMELERFKSASRDSLNEEANSEIKRLKIELEQANFRIDNLTRRSSFSNTNTELLSLILQCTKIIEEHYIREKETVIDQECTKFKELNERLKKRRAGMFGSISLAHSSDMDEIEKGFLAMKRAYEKLILDKKDMKWRWNQVELLTGISVSHSTDEAHVREKIKIVQERNSSKLAPLITRLHQLNDKRDSYESLTLKSQNYSDNFTRQDAVHESKLIEQKSLEEDNSNDDNSSMSPSSIDSPTIQTTNSNSPVLKTTLSHDENKNHENQSPKTTPRSGSLEMLQGRTSSRKHQTTTSVLKKPFHKIGRSRIPSLTRNSIRKDDSS